MNIPRTAAVPPLPVVASEDLQHQVDSFSSSSLQHIAVTLTLVLALATLLRQSYRLSPGYRRSHLNAPEASQIMEPLLTPYPDVDTELSGRGSEYTSKTARFVALDAFRGFTLCLMIFVNYGGGGFEIFKHSIWDGLTVADLVFPWFAWILGFSVFLSSSSHASVSMIQSVISIGQRSSKLFILGIFLNNGDSWGQWRIPGVLQALSVAYLVVAMADLGLPWRRRKEDKRLRIRGFVAWHVMLGVLPLALGNLLLTFLLHVPGCPTGYLGPGGIADDGANRNCTGGAHLFVDSVVFGLHHIFPTPTCQRRYQTGPYDPEGILNWLMVATTSYFGYLHAAIFTEALQQSSESLNVSKNRPLWRLFVCGSILMLLSIPCGGLWVFPYGPWIPLNKNMWSLSYVLLSTGLAPILLAFSVKLIERGASATWPRAPFISVGKNSIAIYIMHEICQDYAPFAPKPLQVGEEVPELELLLCNLVGVAWWVIVAQWMETQNIFIKV